MIRSKTIDAHPTLAGLAVDQASSDGTPLELTIHPYTHLVCIDNNISSLWWVLDDDGNRLLEDGRYVLLRVKSRLASRLAKRAWKRKIKQDWQRGRLVVHERYTENPLGSWIFLAVFSVMSLFLVSFIVACSVIPAWHDLIYGDPGLMPLRYRIMLAVLDIAWLAMTLLICLPLVYMFLLRTRINVTRLCIDHLGLRASLRKDRTISKPWTELRKIQRRAFGTIVNMTFLDGASIWFPKDRLHGRISAVLDCLEQPSQPEKAKIHKSTEDRLIKRTAITCFLGALAGSIMIMFFAPEDPNRLTGIAAVIGLMLTSFGIVYLIAVEDRIVMRITRRRRWKGKRHSKKQSGVLN